MARKKEEKEEIYIWDGKDKQGNIVKKHERMGRSEAAVKAALRRDGNKPTKVRKKPKSLFSSTNKPITAADISVFARQMATMMTAGVPLIQSFEIVGEGHENPTMQTLILQIKGDIEAGGTMADSLRKHPNEFDDLFCNLIDAGEQAGILESLLTKVAIYKEKSEAIRKKIKGALTYPIAIIVVALIVSAILLIFVVPVFADMFTSFGGDLPAMTAFVVKISDFMVANWLPVFGTIGVSVYTFLQLKKRSVKFQHLLQRLSLKLPIFGKLIKLSSIARYARTLSTMFAAGTPMIEAMDSVAGATGNIVYYEATKKIQSEIATGIALAVSMRDTQVFPNMVVQMVQIGEESGAIDAMLGKVADYYEAEVDEMVEAISALMEPMIMAFLGVVIGGLVLAMYMPIFKMGSVI